MVTTKTFSPTNIRERAALDVRAGDTVKVHQKIVERDGKTRIQIFEGLVLARRRGSESGATITVRRIASGVGVEKIYPLYSPMIDKIEVVRRAKVRRAKLYHVREKVAKEIRRQMRNTRIIAAKTEATDTKHSIESQPETVTEASPEVAQETK